MARAMDILDVAGLLRRKWMLALASALVAFVAATVGSLFLPLRYEATTKVRVLDNRALHDIYGSRLAGVEGATENVRAIHEEILSRGNLLALLAELGPDARDRGGTSRDRVMEQERRIREVGGATRVDLVETTRGQFIFRISHRCADPALAQKIVNRLSSGYQERLHRSQKDSAGEALEVVRRKIESLESEYRAATDELATFEEVHADHRFGRSDDTRVRHANEEESRSRSALELEAAEAQLEEVRRRLGREPEWLDVEEEESKEPVAVRIREEIRAAEEVLAALLEKWTEAHPEVQSLERRLQLKREALQSELARDSRRTKREPNAARVALARAEWELIGTIELKRRVLEDHEARLSVLTGLLGAYPELKKQWEALVDRRLALRAQLGALRDQEESARITWQAKTTGNTLIFEVLDPPTCPLTPASPDRALIAVVSVLLAAGAGIGVALGSDLLDTTCRSAAEVAEASGLGVLVSIGRINDRCERVRARRGQLRRRGALVVLILVAIGAGVAQVTVGVEIHELLSRLAG
ncbi:MAG: hypothetical protein MUE73_21305 [Planctomycetes bacterium]|jgi:uncharacterized protein involved in exopolysaccharide biosynthesis|nr:hypothetical protein [Planctomycetota bacterium]